jgi:uncharacterized spore protein YtfJ
MTVDRLFDTIDQIREQAQWQAAFGEPQEIEGQVVIPVAQVSYGGGLGFGQGEGVAQEGEESGKAEGVGEGGGGGGGATTRPMGSLVVTPEEVRFVPTLDVTKISMAGMMLGALAIIQLFTTLRTIFGQD